MSSARFTAILIDPATVPVVEIPGTSLAGTSVVTFTHGGITTLTARTAPPRRELIWMRDLTGTQVGVIS